MAGPFDAVLEQADRLGRVVAVQERPDVVLQQPGFGVGEPAPAVGPVRAAGGGASSGQRNGRVGSRFSSLADWPFSGRPGPARPAGRVRGRSASYTASAVGRAPGSFASIEDTSVSSSTGPRPAGTAPKARAYSGDAIAAACPPSRRTARRR